MNLRGGRAKPTELKVMTGNPGKRPLVERDLRRYKMEPQPAPAFLDEFGKEYWDELMEILYGMGILYRSDIKSIIFLCETWSDFRKACITLEREGRIVESTDKAGNLVVKSHPAFQQKSDADRRMRMWLAEFGLTPSSRSRVKDDGSKATEDTKESYFN